MSKNFIKPQTVDERIVAEANDRKVSYHRGLAFINTAEGKAAAMRILENTACKIKLTKA